MTTTQWLDNDTWMVEANADTGEFAVVLSDHHVEIRVAGGRSTQVRLPPGLEPAMASISQTKGRIRVVIPRRKAA